MFSRKCLVYKGILAGTPVGTLRKALRTVILPDTEYKKYGLKERGPHPQNFLCWVRMKGSVMPAM